MTKKDRNLNDVEMIVNKNKYQIKYMALRQNKRSQGKIRKTC